MNLFLIIRCFAWSEDNLLAFTIPDGVFISDEEGGRVRYDIYIGSPDYPNEFITLETYHEFSIDFLLFSPSQVVIEV